MRRRLSVSELPVDGESLRSFVERLAWANQVPLISMLRYLGLMSNSSRSLPAFGVTLTPQACNTVAALTSADPTLVANMVLSRYHGVCIDLSSQRQLARAPERTDRTGHTPSSAAAERLWREGPDAAEDVAVAQRWAVREWMQMSSSPVCPDCLAEDDAWQLKWRLPWSYCCTSHARLLVDVCPECERQPASDNGKGFGLAGVLSRVPEGTTCSNTLSDARRGTRETCGCDLGDIKSPPVDRKTSAFLIQQQLERELEGPPARDTLRRFELRRSVLAMLLAVGRAQDLCGDLDAASGGAWAQLPQLRWLAGTRTRNRTWTRTPTDSALLSGAMPTVEHAVSTEGFGELIEVLVSHDRRRRHSFKESVRLPPEHRRILTEACARTANRRLSRGGRVRDFDARFVPTMLPAEDVARMASVVNVSRNPAYWGEVLALAVVRQAGGATWKEAAELLGMSVDATTRGNYFATATAGSDPVALRAHLEAIARQHTERAVDYRQKERALAHLGPVPKPVWREMSDMLGLSVGKHAARRRDAAVWAWADAVSANPHRAPVYERSPNESLREVYRRFERWMPEDLVQPLRRWVAEQRTFGEATWPDRLEPDLAVQLV